MTAQRVLAGLTKAAALKTANDGTTVNAICRGWVYTSPAEKQVRARAGTEGIMLEQGKAAVLEEKPPMFTFSTPELVGASAVFPASDSDSIGKVAGAIWANEYPLAVKFRGQLP